MSGDSASAKPSQTTLGNGKPSTPAKSEDVAIRHITFWKNGFSIEGGELMRYDDPNNARILEQINSGRAPAAILGVNPGQPIELRVTKRTEEEYGIAPVKKGLIARLSVSILSVIQSLT
ncbi:SEP-domain-containing protein [Pluteus cervinus]|uniref:SEP-domain-containing protein n=1 Tax=Pluteus cervinus TaxID=181527 RepID=A0ACD3AR80_9AGAR|nr:SEP-domain-containing protein [Pluteus cervinus]